MADKNGLSKREMYLKHIEYLEEELERYQDKRDKLQKKHEDLASRCGALERSHRVLSKKLELSWAEREKEEEEEEELKERLKSQKQAWEQEREALELQHRQRAQKLKEQIDELKSVFAAKSEELKVSAAKSEEYKKRLMEKLLCIKSLETQNKELQAAIVKEREYKEKRKKYRMPEEEVKEHAERSASIILQKERAQQRSMEIQLLQKENVHQQKEIDALQAKLNDLYAEERKMEEMEKHGLEVNLELVQKIEQLKVEVKDLNITNKQMKAKEEDLRRDLALVSKERHQKTAKARQLEAVIQKERNRIRQLEQVMWEADIIIKDILMDPGDSKEMPTTEWKMERVLDILESSAPIETGSNRTSQGQKLQTKTRKPARKLISSSFSSE